MGDRGGSDADARPMTSLESAAVTCTRAQARIMLAALARFGERGVAGTSLQAIADALGVTKAAVYHHFNTKADIVTAVARMQVERLASAVEHAETSDDPIRVRDLLLSEIVDVVVDQRQVVGVLQNDPAIVSALAKHGPFQDLVKRLCAGVIGDPTCPEVLVKAAMVSGMIGSVSHPRVAALDDAALRTHLFSLARRLLELR